MLGNISGAGGSEGVEELVRSVGCTVSGDITGTVSTCCTGETSETDSGLVNEEEMEWLRKTVCCDSSEVCSSPEDEKAEV